MFLNLLKNGGFIEAILFVIVAVFSIIIHELAHGYAAIKNGDLTPKYARRMNFNPKNHFDIIGFGMFLLAGFGWAKPVPINPNNFNNYRKGLFQTSVAGVLTNFSIAFFTFPISALFYNVYLQTFTNVFYYLYFFFILMFSINLSLCVFNLLPIYPLDGFRILESRLRRSHPYIDFMYRYGLYAFVGFLLLINFLSFDILGFMRTIIGFPIQWFWGLFGL